MKEWQTVFQISDDIFEEWKRLAKSTPITYWALKNNKINQKKYFEWASLRYSIPVLKNSFIENSLISQELWNRVKHHSPWNKTLLPIYEWENMVFVGCVEPPDIKKQSIIPILASPDNLQIIWQKLNAFSDTAKKQTVQNIPPAKVKEQRESQNVSTVKPDHNDYEEKTLLTSITNPGAFLKTLIQKTKNHEVKKQASKNIPLDPIFEKCKKYFPQSLIFHFQNNQFIPVQWSPAIKGTPISVTTSKDSIFKIILASKQEYHGFIVENKVHLKFFKSCGFSKLPQHITLIPLFQTPDTPVGAFMGIANSTVDAQHLEEIKTWVENLKETIFKRMHSKTA